MYRPSFLEYRDHYHFKLALSSGLAGVLFYWLLRPEGGEAWGGSWFGYVLGISASVLVLWLLWYGVRKRYTHARLDRRRTDRRRYLLSGTGSASERRGKDRRKVADNQPRLQRGSMQELLSAHVYLGALALILATLHSGLRFGMDIHTIAYALLLVVSASGIFGVVAYVRYPKLMTDNLGGRSIDDVLTELDALAELARERAARMPEEIRALVMEAGTFRVGEGLPDLLGLRPWSCPYATAAERLYGQGAALVEGDHPQRLRDLYEVLLQLQRLSARARAEVLFNARMRIWLYLHVPFSVALLAALIAHVLAILIFW